MTMFELLVFGVSSFSIVFMTQASVWRVKRVRHEIQWLFYIYLVFPSLVAVAAAFNFDDSLIDLTLIYLIHCSLALVLIFTYPAFKGDIPSVRILKFVRDNQGLTKQQIIEGLRTNPAFGSRKMDELISEGLLNVCADSLSLSNKAKFIATFFLWYRRLLGLSDETG